MNNGLSQVPRGSWEWRVKKRALSGEKALDKVFLIIVGPTGAGAGGGTW